MIDNIIHLDKEIFLFINSFHNSFLDSFFWYATKPVMSFPFFIFIFILSIRLLGIKKTIFGVITIIIGIIFVDIICSFFKTEVQKFRPTHTPGIMDKVHTVNGYLGGYYGTFSAHAANSFYTACFISLIAKNKYLTTALLLWASIFTYSRLYLGVHFPLDIICGITLGVISSFIAYKIFKTPLVAKLYN